MLIRGALQITHLVIWVLYHRAISAYKSNTGVSTERLNPTIRITDKVVEFAHENGIERNVASIDTIKIHRKLEKMRIKKNRPSGLVPCFWLIPGSQLWRFCMSNGNSFPNELDAACARAESSKDGNSSIVTHGILL